MYMWQPASVLYDIRVLHDIVIITILYFKYYIILTLGNNFMLMVDSGDESFQTRFQVGMRCFD